ncbi:hypothetical protein KI809_16355 [Geobacter pelophilus]|uniref:Carboxypeptidase regulatory-like domain-containing protein n=1 Tax=Geoanaerobacter pelophilus TaxID=60036 RepID=A0AAW4L4J1_9BACT|nr:carboxypeptidase-like regulatory domain-containing protein [Geoanaerobacter pelophilus]MBT0665883.1 hypothetical protein [Geoanaerobacter pelophilus]
MKGNFCRLLSVLLCIGCFTVSAVAENLAYTVSGIIYGGSAPLPEASIIIVDSLTLSPIKSVTSDSKGYYSGTVEKGKYNLEITPPTDSEHAVSYVNGIEVSNSNVIQNIVLTKDSTSSTTITGYVKTELGTAAHNMRVIIDSGENFGSGLTDLSGKYFVTLISENSMPAGTVFNANVSSPAAQQTAEIPIKVEWSISNILFHAPLNSLSLPVIVLPHFPVLRGRTTDHTGMPVGGVRVKTAPRTYSWSNEGITYNYESDMGDDTVTSDEKGYYSITLLPNPSYEIQIISPSGMSHENRVYSGVAIFSDVSMDLALNPSKQ